MIVPTSQNAVRAVLLRLDRPAGADPDLTPGRQRPAPAEVSAVVLSDDEIEV